MPDDTGSLNANHVRALTSAFSQIDRLLADVERACAAQPSQSPFARYLADLTPAQRQLVLEYVERIRNRMGEVMAQLGVRDVVRRVAATWAISSDLTFMAITLDDVSPSRLRGYGELDAAAAAFVRRVLGDLDRSVTRVRAYLQQGLGRDLAARLERLAEVPVSAPLLKVLERVIGERGLVELRAPMEALVEQLETHGYEIALFGRVSAGKSSLLNAVLETEALPVGVTPITAVPTRVRWGESAIAEVRFADGTVENIGLDRVADFVSERQNPENRKHVTRVDVRLPSPRLRDGIVFVDTPGVGALATEGARSSYAYLPRCDLGIVLVDASGTPTREDIELLRLLYDSGIPGRIVISKADLLDEPSVAQMAAYVEAELQRTLGLSLPVHFVSAKGDATALARQWFATEIAPMFAEARALADASSRRKLAHLRESVVAALKALSGRHDDRDAAVRRERVEQLASKAELALRDAERRCQRLSERARDLAPEALAIAARLLVDAEDGHDGPELLRRALAGAAERISDALRDELVGLRDLLRDVLTAMAETQPQATTHPAELNADLLGRPTFEVPAEATAFEPKPRRWLRAVPGVRAQRIETELRSHLLDAAELAFARFSSASRTWSRAAVQRLGEQFAAQSEPIRVQARRIVGEGAGMDAEAIAADLAEIERLAT